MSNPTAEEIERDKTVFKISPTHWGQAETTTINSLCAKNWVLVYRVLDSCRSSTRCLSPSSIRM